MGNVIIALPLCGLEAPQRRLSEVGPLSERYRHLLDEYRPIQACPRERGYCLAEQLRGQVTHLLPGYFV